MGRQVGKHVEVHDEETTQSISHESYEITNEFMFKAFQFDFFVSISIEAAAAAAVVESGIPVFLSPLMSICFLPSHFKSEKLRPRLSAAPCPLKHKNPCSENHQNWVGDRPPSLPERYFLCFVAASPISPVRITITQHEKGTREKKKKKGKRQRKGRRGKSSS